jgi:uncharacterized protein YjiS (DUF1127 family)
MAGTNTIAARQRPCRYARPQARRDWIALFKKWRRRARGRRELAALGERALRDIGVSRYDAYHEASKPFWRA